MKQKLLEIVQVLWNRKTLTIKQINTDYWCNGLTCINTTAPGLTMYVLADNVNFYLGEGVEGAKPNVAMLTAMFFFLNFLAATQVNIH